MSCISEQNKPGFDMSTNTRPSDLFTRKKIIILCEGTGP